MEEQEFMKLKNEIINSQTALHGEKMRYLSELNSGLGETIKKELKTPTKPRKWAVWRYKFRVFVIKIKDKILTKKIMRKENSLARFLYEKD